MPPRYSLIPSTPPEPCRAPETMVSDSRISRISSTPMSGKRDSIGALQRWRAIVDTPDAFPPKIWQLFLQSSSPCKGKYRQVCVACRGGDSSSQGLYSIVGVATEELNWDVRQCRASVGGEMDHVGVRARALQETAQCLVLANCFNALNTVSRMMTLDNAFSSVPALRLFIAKCCKGASQANFLFRMDSVETQMVACSSGVHKRDPVRGGRYVLPVIFNPFREKFGGKGLETFACMGGISLGRMGVAANTIRFCTSLRHELDDIGILASLTKAVVLSGKDTSRRGRIVHSLLEGADVRIADEKEMPMVGVSVGTGEQVVEHPVRVMRDGGAGHLARSLADIPDEQTARRPSLPLNPSGRGQASLRGSCIRGCPSQHVGGQTIRRGGHINDSSLYRGTTFLPR